MQNRLIVGTFAFLLTLGAFQVAHLVLGTPAAIGPVISLVLSTLILLDPAQLVGDPPRR